MLYSYFYSYFYIALTKISYSPSFRTASDILGITCNVHTYSALENEIPHARPRGGEPGKKKPLVVPQLQCAVLGTSLNARDTSNRIENSFVLCSCRCPPARSPKVTHVPPTDVPWGDFLEQPPRVPSGTRLRCSAVALSLSNPRPTTGLQRRAGERKLRRLRTHPAAPASPGSAAPRSLPARRPRPLAPVSPPREEHEAPWR